MLASSLERETGIEPATNSLEGCDSTTELLPPSRLAAPSFHSPLGGEGRVRTSVALRRQVYSLLRLTALPPPQKLFLENLRPQASAPFNWFLLGPDVFDLGPLLLVWNPCVFGAFLKGATSRSVELAEGFEPPTG